MSASRVVEDEAILDEEFSDIQEEVEEQAAPEEEKPRASDKVRTKFKDKGIEDVLMAYESLEKEYGAKGNEIGELRRLTDELLQLQINEKQSKQKSEEPKKPLIDVDSLLDNPEEALSKAVANNPEIRAMREQMLKSERAKAQQAFEQDHPDWKELVSDRNFQEWVTSSQLRTKLFQEADRNYDYQTGSELLSMYKQINGIAKENVEKKRSKSLKAASVEKGSTGNKPVKVYRRADLINLRINDPAKYDAMQDDIMAAYAEGRVR